MAKTIRSYPKTLLILIFFIGATMTTAIAKEQNKTKQQPTDFKSQIQTWETSNGANVLFIESHENPIVDVQVTFAAGSAYDGKNYGLASLTASLLETGVKGIDENELINRITEAGANISEHSSRDATTFSLRSMSIAQYLTPAVELFSKILTTPIFPQTQFERVKSQQLTAIKMDDQYPDEVAYKALMKALYPNHPYGHPVDGTTDSVNGITLDDVKAFYQKYYVAKNATIAIIGDMDQQEARALSERIIQNLPVGEKAPAIAQPKPMTKSETIHINFPSSQTTILKGTLGIKKGSPEFYALSAANQVLGGDGMRTLLFENIRKDRGLAYGAHSVFRTLKEQGFFLIEAKTRNDKANETLEVMNQTLNDFIKQGPTKDQLNQVKKYLIGSFPLSMATNRSKLSILSLIGFYHLPLDYMDTYTTNIEKLSPSEIKKSFDAIINPNKMITVTVGQG